MVRLGFHSHFQLEKADFEGECFLHVRAEHALQLFEHSKVFHGLLRRNAPGQNLCRLAQCGKE
jgi:hypothetical protein